MRRISRATSCSPPAALRPAPIVASSCGKRPSRKPERSTVTRLLQDYLTVFATRVIILALFALSFDLVWGYAGIMSFGQALFFGSAGYGVALLARDLDVTNIFLVLPAGTIIGLTFALLLGGFLLLGRHPSSVIFVSLGTLT